MRVIDGSQGEGGGQVLRTSLALSALTGEPMRLERIRAGRAKPGLMRQHLTAVDAMARLCGARVEGAQVGATSLTFVPGPLTGGTFTFAIGTAGSTTLVAQTVLPALLWAPQPSVVAFEGGTHNPMAPPYDHFAGAFLPCLRRLGAAVEAELERPGFVPAGGGRFTLRVQPLAGASLAHLDLRERGAPERLDGEVLFSKLPFEVARRELEVLRVELPFGHAVRYRQVVDSPGPGNMVVLRAAHTHVTEVFSAVGERGVQAEDVALQAARAWQAWNALDVPVGEHLADQLLLPLALGAGGTFRTAPPTLHTRTQAALLEAWLPVRVDLQPEGAGAVWRVEVARR
jgi:RNA 3'-terminal phosphate cyclase (ATP)